MNTVTTPKGITRIDIDAYPHEGTHTDIDVLHLSSDIQEVNTSGVVEFRYTLPKAYQVDEDNPRFTVVDGVLFSKDMKTLMAFPRRDEDFEYIIPDGVKCIHEEAFFNAKHLVSVVIPDSVEEIEHCAFVQCTSLRKVVLPKSLKNMVITAFHCCHLEEISIDPSNAHYRIIDNVLFSKDMKVLVKYLATKKEASYQIPEGVAKIEDRAFENADILQHIEFPSSLKEIGWMAFANCKGLKQIKLPAGLQHLEDFSFGGCSNLKEVEGLSDDFILRMSLTKAELKVRGLKPIKFSEIFHGCPVTKNLHAIRVDVRRKYEEQNQK